MIWLRAGAVVLVIVGCARSAEAAFSIVEDGAARAIVVIPEDAQAIAAYAAEELVFHIQRATGVALGVVEESAIPQAPARRIFLGSTKHAEEAGIDVSALAQEAFVLRVTDDSIIIAGKDGPGDPLSEGHGASGTLWGVYEFLDRELGVRWVWPGDLGTYVPRRAVLAVASQERSVAPRFQWQRLRHGFRGNDPSIGFTEGGLEAYRTAQTVFLRRYRMSQHDRPRFGHAFGGWWAQYGAEHPDWFQEVDGKRGPRPDQREDRVSMCVSNPGLHDKVFENWVSELETSDRTPTLSLPEADTRGWCHCATCLQWDAPQPSADELEAMTRSIARTYSPRNMSDRYARFWKLMHERAAAIAPDVRTTAYVYVNYFVVPAEPVAFSSNVHLDFVPWGDFWFPRPIQEQQWVKEQWLGWQKTGAAVSYRPNYFHDGYVMPHVFARQFADIFQFVERNGAVATDFDSLKGQWATQGTTLYLLARLHTHPRASVDELLAEYYEAFGPAKEAVRAYFDFWEAHTTANEPDMYEVQSEYAANRLHAYARAAHAWYPPASFVAAQEFLDDAAEAVADAPQCEYAERVAFLRAGLEHARKAVALAALFADDEAGEAQRAAAYKELVAFRRAHEGLFFSNLDHAAHVETRSWGDRPGFIGR
jgi:hypothetical protein